MDGNMQQREGLMVDALASPAALIVVIWLGALILVATGPIEYPGQPSPVVLAVVGLGLAIFLTAYQGGRLAFGRLFMGKGSATQVSSRMLNDVAMATSLFGIVGIALITFDRTILSGVNNGAYSELLRCAPELVDAISIRRTPLLYSGYAMFSFGFVAVVLFLLRGEEIRGSAAALAQLSIVSPIGYALLYSGRMPILFVIVLFATTMLVRRTEGRSALPRGHHLMLKTVIAIGLFSVYSSAIWTSRQNFCAQMSPLIAELQEKRRSERASHPKEVEARLKAAEIITAAELNKRVAESSAEGPTGPVGSTVNSMLDVVMTAWDVKPRGYIVSAMDAGHLSPRAAIISLSTYFYLTHGIRTIDTVWRAREKFTPQLGLYEIGILSPLLRVFFPENKQVGNMESEQREALIYGFFPSVWGAAFIDFGLIGAILYIVIWGGLSGWSAAGARNSCLMTPPLLLVFALASVLLSPVQGPLGMANSALVLLSMFGTGLVLDFVKPRAAARRHIEEIGASGSV